VLDAALRPVLDAALWPVLDAALRPPESVVGGVLAA